MFLIKHIGKWRETRLLLANYEERFSHAISSFTKSIAEEFLVQVRKGIPSGGMFDDYRDSLKVVSVGERYAVVSDREAVNLSEIEESDSRFGIVVMVTPVMGNAGADALALMLAEQSLWTLDTIPRGVRKSKVRLVHKRVMKSEEDFVRSQAKAFVIEKRPELTALGAKVGRVKEGEKKGAELNSLPDFMTLALRMEFGINSEHRPHWGPALNAMKPAIRTLLRSNKEIASVLYDYKSSDHMRDSDNIDSWSKGRFDKEAVEFEKALGNRK